DRFASVATSSADGTKPTATEALDRQQKTSADKLQETATAPAGEKADALAQSGRRQPKQEAEPRGGAAGTVARRRLEDATAPEKARAEAANGSGALTPSAANPGPDQLSDTSRRDAASISSPPQSAAPQDLRESVAVQAPAGGQPASAGA